MSEKIQGCQANSSTSCEASSASPLQSGAELEALRKIVRDFHWMARRYADGRSSYAPGMFNDHVKTLQSFGFDFHQSAPLFARDGMGRDFDKLSPDDVAAAERDMPKGFSGSCADADARLKADLLSARERIAEQAKRIAEFEAAFGPIRGITLGDKFAGRISEAEAIELINSVLNVKMQLVQSRTEE